jgi:hypothetical protein
LALATGFLVLAIGRRGGKAMQQHEGWRSSPGMLRLRQVIADGDKSGYKTPREYDEGFTVKTY